MKQYQDFLRHILENGVIKEDRTGTGTISTFGYQMRFDLSKGFPLLTTKKMATKAVISELLWFLEGSTDERRLAEIHYGLNRREIKDKKTIWTANADNQGVKLGYRNDDLVKELGPVYGKQWRKSTSTEYFDNVFFEDVDDGEEYYYEDTFLLKDNIDQIQNVIDEIKINPDSRRLIVSAWDVAEISRMALPPCHTMFQFYVINGRLSCQLYQRSADAFLGVPFNIASYALLTMMIAQVCDLEVGEFIHTFGDAHIYTNHIEQVKEQLNREPLELPTLKINPAIKNIDDFKMSDFELMNYSSHDAIKAEMAI